MGKLVVLLGLVLAATSALSGTAVANDALRFLPGANPVSRLPVPHMRNLDDQRRLPGLRHQSQMQRHNARRAAQRTQANRARSRILSVPAVKTLPTTIRPTAFTYVSALTEILKVAEGQRISFLAARGPGYLELLKVETEGDTTCRRFRQQVRTSKGAEISFGSACRMRDGAWRFSKH